MTEHLPEQEVVVPVERKVTTFRTSEEVDKIAALMVKVYAEMEQPKMDKENPHFKSKYASPAAVDDVVRKVCGKHGVFVIQTIRDDRTLDCWVVTTRTMEAGGQWMETDTPYIMPQGGMGAGPQKHGSSQTYAKRYGMVMHFCLAADADDDGNVASEGAGQRSQSRGRDTAFRRKPQQSKPKPTYEEGVAKINVKAPCPLCKAPVKKGHECVRNTVTGAVAHKACYEKKVKGEELDAPAPPEEEAEFDQRDEDERAEEASAEEEVDDEPTLEEQLDGILANKAADIADAIALIEDQDSLARLMDMEKADQNRKTVVSAIAKRQAALSDDLPF